MPARYYIGAGQSNCVELAETEDLLPGYTQLADLDADCEQVMRLAGPGPAPRAWQDYGPEDLQPRFAVGDPGGPRNLIGHSITIGRGLTSFYGPDSIVVARFAVPGTSLAQEWLPSSPPMIGEVENLYDQLIGFITTQVPELGQIKGFYWTQGNGDAAIEADADVYAANLTTLFTTLRTALGLPNLKIVFDQMPPLMTGAFTATVRAQQALYAASDPNSITIATDDTYTLRAGGNHYTAQTHMRLGWEMANAFIGQAGAFGTLGNV